MDNARTIVIPSTPVSKNVWQRQHWAARNRTKKEWHDWVWAQVNTHPRMPRPLQSVRADVTVVWNKRGPLPDWHNLEMAFECVADGLVRAGIIEDDSGRQFVRGELRLVRGERAETLVTLWYGAKERE